MKALALVCCLLVGCWGYNSSAKRWAYVGDSLLILGGGAAIAVDQTTKPATCTGSGCPSYTPPISGALVAGVVLAAAGLFGIIFNATRAEVKTSR
jgi:hypothetical protein